jgi:anti-repressor protein
MNQLIKIGSDKISGEVVQTVNARELYTFLGSKADFTTWIKTQVERARLVENRDFVCSTKKGSNGRGGHNAKEYHFTTESAKHISMMSGCDKGFEVRDYFIECERQAKRNAISLPKTFAEALRLAADQAERLAIMAPKVEAFGTFLSCKNAMPFNEAAKVLGTGRGKLFDFCRESGLLMSGGTNHNLPYQSFKDRGYFDVREVIIQHSDWQERKSQTLITTEGIEYIRKKMKGETV